MPCLKSERRHEMDVDRGAVKRDHFHISRHRGAGRQTDLHRVTDERVEKIADYRDLMNQRDNRGHE